MAIIRDYIDGQFGGDPEQEVGIGQFTTLVRVRERSSRTADVPTTFLEDGSHVNDHIIRNPLTVSIEGNVSDVHLRPSPFIAAQRDTQAAVGVITQYLPSRTQAQVSRVSGIVADVNSAIDRVDAVINDTQRVGDFLGLQDSEARTNQEAFIDQMEAIYNSGALIKIDMPYRTHSNMVVTSLEVTRDNQQNALFFTLEAQQFRFAETVFVDAGVAAPNPSRETEGQLEGAVDKGVQEGEEQAQSFLSSTLERFGVGD